MKGKNRNFEDKPEILHYMEAGAAQRLEDIY